MAKETRRVNQRPITTRPYGTDKSRPGGGPVGSQAQYDHERDMEEIRHQHALELERNRAQNARDLYVFQHGPSDTTIVGGFSAEAKGGRFRVRGGLKSKKVRYAGDWGTGVGGTGLGVASGEAAPGGGVRVTNDWWAPVDTWATRDKDGKVVAPEYTGLDLGDMNFPRGNGRFQGGVLDRTFIARMTQQLMGGMSPDDPNYGRAYDRARAAAREMHNQGLANFQSWARGQRELRDRMAREQRRATREERALEASRAPVQQPEAGPAETSVPAQQLPPGYSVAPKDDTKTSISDLYVPEAWGKSTQAAAKGGSSGLPPTAISYWNEETGEYGKKETPVAAPAPEKPLPTNIADYSDKDIERASGALVKGTAGKWTTPPASNSPVPQKVPWQQAEQNASGSFETTGTRVAGSHKYVNKKTGKVESTPRVIGTLKYRPNDDALGKRTVADWEKRGVGGAGLKSAQANTLRQARDQAQAERDLEPLNDELAGRNRPAPLKSVNQDLKTPQGKPSLSDRLRAIPAPENSYVDKRPVSHPVAPTEVVMPKAPPLDRGLDDALIKEAERSRRGARFNGLDDLTPVYIPGDPESTQEINRAKRDFLRNAMRGGGTNGNVVGRFDAALARLGIGLDGLPLPSSLAGLSSREAPSAGVSPRKPTPDYTRERERRLRNARTILEARGKLSRKGYGRYR